MGTLWRLKDDLPGRDLVCVGRHLARVVALVSPSVVPALVAARDEPELDAVELEVLEAVGAAGVPLTGPELRELLGRDKRSIDRAVSSLHRHLLLTHGHLEAGAGAWGATAHDLLARKWRLPKRLPAQEAARRRLAGLVLDGAGELTAADLGGVFGWRRRVAAEVLDGVAESREEPGFRVWARP
jgi:hypothetical protein